MDRHLLILDLDETLIYATEEPLTRPPEFRLAEYSVYRRPFLDDFLLFVREHFVVAVWSSATATYVEQIARQVFPWHTDLRFIWSRERCTRRFDGERLEEYWLKDLKKVKRAGYSLDRVLMIDDSPEKLERHYGNLIRVRPFVGDTTDEELRTLIVYLDRLRTCDKLRSIEKRNWRTAR